ncbi:uncharacterized protein LOC119271557 [Triticum dicoccoides]|uniref:uncharacterized protein LOC119271557 n=1 Tax=Triticum dicoccoides TaxID=85692 RepID=UPI00188F9900|nr:uncharacterized protein LOC119271557 [Triticum dicoccoides]
MDLGPSAPSSRLRPRLSRSIPLDQESATPPPSVRRRASCGFFTPASPIANELLLSLAGPPPGTTTARGARPQPRSSPDPMGICRIWSTSAYSRPSRSDPSPNLHHCRWKRTDQADPVRIRTSGASFAPPRRQADAALPWILLVREHEEDVDQASVALVGPTATCGLLCLGPPSIAKVQPSSRLPASCAPGPHLAQGPAPPSSLPPLPHRALAHGEPPESSSALCTVGPLQDPA